MLIALAMAASMVSPTLPLAEKTPGVVDPAKTLAVICVRGYTAQAGVRHVTDATKRAVFAEYHVDPKVGGPYEIDHLISLEIGGSNDIRNLWPQSYTSTPWNAHLKDVLENKLHALACTGKITLAEAQTAISADWTVAYVKFVGPAPR